MELGPGLAADRLLDPRSRRFLYPFLGEERSLTDAAAVLEVSLPRMAYQVGRLCEVGLLEESRTVPRRGRPIRMYRAVADTFELPLSTFPDDLEQLLAEGGAGWEDELRRNLLLAGGRHQGGSLRRLPNGHMHFGPPIDTLASTAVWASWTTLNLSRRDQAQLAAELRELWQRWMLTGASRERSGHTVVLRLAVA